jgi:hypothetical protein
MIVRLHTTRSPRLVKSQGHVARYECTAKHLQILVIDAVVNSTSSDQRQAEQNRRAMLENVHQFSMVVKHYFGLSLAAHITISIMCNMLGFINNAMSSFDKIS